MILSRFNVFILSAAACMHAVGDVKHDGIHSITVRGQLIPAACTLSVSEKNVNFGEAAHSTGTVTDNWSYWAGKSKYKFVTVKTSCVKPTASVIRLVDNSGIDMSGEKKGPYENYGDFRLNRRLYGMGVAAGKVVAAYSVEADDGINGDAPTAAWPDLASAKSGKVGHDGWRPDHSGPGTVYGRVKLGVGQPLAFTSSNITLAFLPFVKQDFRASDRLDVSGALLLELYML